MWNISFACLAMNPVSFFIIIIKNQVKCSSNFNLVIPEAKPNNYAECRVAVFAVGSLPVVQSAVASTTEFTPQTLINNTGVSICFEANIIKGSLRSEMV